MINDNATPRPWTIEIWKYNNITQDCKSVITNGYDAVCEIYNVERGSPIESRSSYKANAELIVRAVNNHDALLEALKQAEFALGENLVWITDKFDLEIRQSDKATLAKLNQLNQAHISICKAIANAEKA